MEVHFCLPASDGLKGKIGGGRQTSADQHLTQAVRFGSSPDAPDRISAARPPLGRRYVTENSTAPGHRRTTAKACEF
jgi:hypothetical protein